MIGSKNAFKELSAVMSSATPSLLFKLSNVICKGYDLPDAL